MGRAAQRALQILAPACAAEHAEQRGCRARGKSGAQQTVECPAGASAVQEKDPGKAEKAAALQAALMAPSRNTRSRQRPERVRSQSAASPVKKRVRRESRSFRIRAGKVRAKDEACAREGVWKRGRTDMPG